MNRRGLWLIVGLFGVYLIVDGLSVSWVTARLAEGGATLAHSDEAAVFPVLQTTSPGDEPADGVARRIRTAEILFGLEATYGLPDGSSVACRHTPVGSFCPAGWTYRHP